jgi:predicted Zn-dependent protease
MHLARGSDSAIADLTALIDHREHIEDSTLGPCISKDFLYYAVGFLRTGQSRYAEARAAYESALSENLGFYMAHVRLSRIDVALHDTTAALTELEAASLIRADDPSLLTLHGQILVGQRRLDDAERELRAAVHADTDFALPYAFLGQVAENRHDTTRALGRYREYLARASRSAPERGWVEARVTRLAK